MLGVEPFGKRSNLKIFRRHRGVSGEDGMIFDVSSGLIAPVSVLQSNSHFKILPAPLEPAGGKEFELPRFCSFFFFLLCFFFFWRGYRGGTGEYFGVPLFLTLASGAQTDPAGAYVFGKHVQTKAKINAPESRFYLPSAFLCLSWMGWVGVGGEWAASVPGVRLSSA